MTTPRPDDLDALPGIVISTIRTITPYLVGWLIAAALWIARPLGLDLPEGAAEYLTGTLPILLGSIYYMAARKLEARWPGVPWLGSRTQPVYPRRAADDDYYPDLPDHGEPDQTLAALDTTAPDGYETSEVSAAKTLVGDILGTDFGGYDNGDLDTLVAADRIINQLVAGGWRPTIEDDPYFVSEELLREIDRQRK
jgi:hypothetical protein